LWTETNGHSANGKKISWIEVAAFIKSLIQMLVTEWLSWLLRQNYFRSECSRIANYCSCYFNENCRLTTMHKFLSHNEEKDRRHKSNNTSIKKLLLFPYLYVWSNLVGINNITSFSADGNIYSIYRCKIVNKYTEW
jgi:hypothetical protein